MLPDFGARAQESGSKSELRDDSSDGPHEIGGTSILPRVSNTLSRKDAAIQYAMNGWRVLPVHSPKGDGCSCGGQGCSSIGKHPYSKDWVTAATSDVSTVRQWWEKWPNANIGLALDGIAVLDVDPKNGGDKSLHDLEEKYEQLDPRSRERTGSGGWHYLFHAPPGLEINRGFLPGLEFADDKLPNRHHSIGSPMREAL